MTHAILSTHLKPRHRPLEHWKVYKSTPAHGELGERLQKVERVTRVPRSCAGTATATRTQQINNKDEFNNRNNTTQQSRLGALRYGWCIGYRTRSHHAPTDYSASAFRFAEPYDGDTDCCPVNSAKQLIPILGCLTAQLRS